MARLTDRQELRIEYLSVNDLTPYEKNARKHDKKSVDVIKASIEQFGMNDPIGIWGDKNIVVEGHGRLMACKELKIDKVPCIRLDNLTDEQRRAYMLAHNKTAEISDWDFDLLSAELAEIEDIAMEDFGFDLAEFEEEKKIIEDEVPEVDETKDPTTKLGDIWQLGNHRLICGDSTDPLTINLLMQGNKADMLFTDPPYNVNIEKKSKELLKSNNYSKIENDNLSADKFQKFLKCVFTNARENLKNTASYYVFSCQGGDQEMMMMMMMRECDMRCRHQLIWVKDAPVFSMGRLDYDYKHEPILYGWLDKHTFYRKGDQDKSVWEYKRTENKLHPTMKPVELIVNALKNSTLKDGIVLDLFGGSGSTLIACEQVERICYMCELDPKYCDVIIKRWETLTGKKAELIK